VGGSPNKRFNLTVRRSGVFEIERLVDKAESLATFPGQGRMVLKV